MKVITKILNVLLVILVVSGVVFPILYFTSISKNNVKYDDLLSKNTQLTEQIETNNYNLLILKDSIAIKNAEINYSNERIHEQQNYIKSLESKLQEDLDNLTNMSLEEVLDYILNYYGTNNAELITHNNTLQVVIQEPLVREWSNTITKLESRNIEVLGYKDQVNNYETIMDQYIGKIDLLEQSDSLLRNSLDLEQEKNTNFQNIIDNRNKKIKSLKIQLGTVGGIAVVIIVLALI